MSSTTIKHNLHKIDGTDAPPDITVLNANWDYIDSLLGIASELSSNVIASNTNMNNVTKAGLHKCETSTIAATLTNSPTNNAFALLVENHASGGYKQTVTEYNTTSPKMWFRNKSADTWSSWIKIYTGVDKPTKSDVGLGNVDNTSDANKPISTATQTALDTKQETITGGASTITTSNLGTNKALISNGSGKVVVSSVTSTELGYLSGVTSAIQTQLNGKVPTTRKINDKALSADITLSASDVGAQATVTGAATTITGSNLTTNRALISNGSGKVAVSAVTATELGYLDGVTSNIQTQFGNKVSTSGDTLSGSLTFNNTDSYHALQKYRVINSITYGVNIGCGQLGGKGVVSLECRNGNTTTSPTLGRLEIGELGVSYVDSSGIRSYLVKGTLTSSTTEQ